MTMKTQIIPLMSQTERNCPREYLASKPQTMAERERTRIATITARFERDAEARVQARRAAMSA
jgi:hypothetical protein